MLLPVPLAPTSATVSPGSSSRSSSSRTSSGRDAYAKETRSKRMGASCRVGRDQAAGADGRRGLQQAQHAVGNGQAVGARVELRAELAQRCVELRRENQDRQPGLETEPTAVETNADGDRDERDAQRRRQLQHRSGEEADPQRAHRGPPVLLAHLDDRLGLSPTAVERAKGRQPAHDVEEVRREQPQRVPALPRALLGVPADQPHEERHERERHQHDQGGLDVDPRRPGEHRDRHEAGEHDLGQVAAEVGLEPVHALNRGGGDLGALGAVERGRLGAQAALDECKPELGEHRPGCAPPCHLESPGEQPTGGEHEHEQDELARDVV